MNKFDLDTALGNLTEDQKKKPVFIITGGPFMDSPLYFYNKGKFYEGKTDIVREVIKSRSKGEPTPEEIEMTVKKFNESNKGIIFNIHCTTNYGSWVIEGLKIRSKKETDKEMLQIIIDATVEVGNLGKFSSNYKRNPLAYV